MAIPLIERIATDGVFSLPADKDDKFVVLTIDDAPSSRTDEILRILENHSATATFFVHIDQITIENEHHLKAAIAAGHEIGNHLPKDYPAWKMSKDEFEAALTQSAIVLSEYGDGAKPYFRPPHGIYRPQNMDQALARASYDRPLSSIGSDRSYILASFIPWDAGGDKTNTDDIEKNARRANRYATQLARNIYPGAIVVFHDGEAGGREARLAATMVSLETFLTSMDEQGYDVISLSEGIERVSRQE